MPLPFGRTVATSSRLRGAIFVLATVLLTGSTAADAESLLCRLKRCDDGDPCTIDSCHGLGTCVFEPVRCDDHNPCTADIAPGECTSATCAPQTPGADGAGCLPGTPVAGGAMCAEDGLPCTDDVCRNDDCTHVAVPNVETCEPVTKAFRLTLVLASQARSTATNLQRLAPQAEPMRARALGKLAQTEAALRDTADALAGKTPGATTHRAGGFAPTVGQLRAIDAAERMAGVPAQVRDAIRALRRLAPTSDPELLALTIEQARSLRRGIRRFKVELKRLRRVHQTFAL